MHLDPTLVVFERGVRGDDPAVIRSPALADASPALLANWRAFFTFSIGWTPDDFARARAAWPKALQLTKRLHDRGVLLTAGTEILAAAGVEKGSGEPHKTKVARLTREQVRTIAETKMPDLNANDLDAAEKIIAGTARQMGITVEGHG
jgi:hypothetical protein